MVSLSIVMTCYNLEKYVAEALRSVFDQDYKGPMELIVVDDCSTDNTLANIKETVAAYGSGWKVQVVQPEHNLGVAGATDYGWQFAKNDWIVMVDGDDVQYPDRCRNTANLVERHPQAMMLMCSADHADESGNVYGYQGYCWKPYDESPEEMYLVTPDERMENFLSRTAIPNGVSLAAAWPYGAACTKDGETWRRERQASALRRIPRGHCGPIRAVLSWVAG